MDDNRLAELLLEYMPYPEKRYTPLVLICKNKEISEGMLNKFKATCAEEKITLIDGLEAILSGNSVDFDSEQNICVIFEDLQVIAGNHEHEQRFFEIFNIAFDRTIPILITLNNNSRYLPFEERNFCRFTWGMKAEIN